MSAAKRKKQSMGIIWRVQNPRYRSEREEISRDIAYL